MADNLQVSAKISDEKSVNILTLSVVRRDGAITPFKSEKISFSCLAAYRLKNNFTGSYIRINNLINKCDVEPFEQNGSKIDIINYEF